MNIIGITSADELVDQSYKACSCCYFLVLATHPNTSKIKRADIKVIPVVASNNMADDGEMGADAVIAEGMGSGGHQAR